MFNISQEKRVFGNPDIALLIEYLKRAYPIPIEGITDRRMLKTLIQVSTPRKGRDEWMSEDWKVNFMDFMQVYLVETDKKYLVRSVYRLKDKVKDWRELGGYEKGDKTSLVG